MLHYFMHFRGINVCVSVALFYWPSRSCEPGNWYLSSHICEKVALMPVTCGSGPWRSRCIRDSFPHAKLWMILESYTKSIGQTVKTNQIWKNMTQAVTPFFSHGKAFTFTSPYLPPGESVSSVHPNESQFNLFNLKKKSLICVRFNRIY